MLITVNKKFKHLKYSNFKYEKLYKYNFIK